MLENVFLTVSKINITVGELSVKNSGKKKGNKNK